jgi:hypothetical protein
MTREYLERSHRQLSDYETYLEERFQGEVYGEALFRTMADLAVEAGRAKKFRVLEQLERETKELLREAVREAGGTDEENPQRISEGETLGAQLAKAPWHGLMSGFQAELKRFVADFEQAEALAPPGKESLLRHVTAHERALLEFATLELEASQSKNSLTSVLALLRTSPTA